MFPKTVHIEITGSTVALYGAVLATITATAQVISFLRDRTSVKVTYQRNMEVIGHPDPRYQNMPLTMLKAANSGRRPVTITGMGAYRLYPRKAFVCGDTTPHLPVELTEGKYVTALIDERDLDFENLEAFEAWDALGRSFKCNIAPLHKRTWSRLMRRLRAAK
jgi:hypothetical protein